MHPYLIEIPLPWGSVFRLPSYGFMIMCGFLCALWLSSRRGRRVGIPPAVLLDVAVVSLLGGIIGARIYYVIQEWSYFANTPLDIVRFDKGGLVFYGGIIGGGGCLLVMTVLKKQRLWRVFDVVSSVVPLAHAFGRVGCFLNGCCFGRATQSWIGMRFPRILSAGGGGVLEGQEWTITGSPVFLDHLNRGLVDETMDCSLPVHPTQLYAVGYNLIIFGLLSYVFLRRRREGNVAWTYLVCYGLARFVNEFFRADQPEVFAGLTGAQLMCAVLAAFGLIMLAAGRRKERRPIPEPWAPPPAEGS